MIKNKKNKSYLPVIRMLRRTMSLLGRGGGGGRGRCRRRRVLITIDAQVLIKSFGFVTLKNIRTWPNIST